MRLLYDGGEEYWRYLEDYKRNFAVDKVEKCVKISTKHINF